MTKKSLIGIMLLVCFFTAQTVMAESFWIKNFYVDGDYNIIRDNDLSRTLDGGFMLTGNSSAFGNQGILVSKLDSNGIIEWKKRFGNSNSFSSRDRLQVGNEHILVGSTYSMSWGYVGAMFKMDENGDVISGSEKELPEFSFLTNIIKTSDNGFLVCGEKQIFSSANKIIFLKLSSSLQIEWQTTLTETQPNLPGHAKRLCEIPGVGYFFAFAYNKVARINLDGTLGWNKSFKINVLGQDCTVNGTAL